MHSRLENQTTDATPTKSTFFESVREKMGGFIDYIKSDGKDNPQMTRRDMFGVLAGAGIGLSGCAVTGVNTITDDDLHKFMQKHNIQLPGVQRDGTWAAVGKGKSYDEAVTKARTELAERGFTESGTPTVEPLGKEKWIVMVKGVKNIAEDKTSHQPDIEPPEPTKEKHLSLNHKKHGRVHVWHPEHTGQLDEVIIYTHGYIGKNSSIDDYWKNLQEQFKASGRKALFIAPRVAAYGADKVRWWKNSEGLINYSVAEAGGKVGKKVTVVSHSSGKRLDWLNNPNIETIISLDCKPWKKKFYTWSQQEGKRLILVSAPRSRNIHERFSRRYKRITTFNRIPDELSEDDKSSNILYFKLNTRHGSIPDKRTGIIQRLLGLLDENND